MIYMHISDEYDIAEAVKQLIAANVEAHESDAISDLHDKIDNLDNDMIELQDIANSRQERIEYLEGLLKENGIEFI